MSTLERMLAGGVEDVDMFTVVIVGSSVSREVAGRFVTPRGYRWKGEHRTGRTRGACPAGSGRRKIVETAGARARRTLR